MRPESKILLFLDQNAKKLLWFFTALYIIIFSLFSIWKFNNFLYNGLDLAIINQVFYNSSFGNFFASSIQGHLYLGDHFTPILVLVLPFYILWKSPITLLILQSTVLGLTAWPIYLITKSVFNTQSTPNSPKLLLSSNKRVVPVICYLLFVIWLLNPFVHNINLFEFHFLAFAIFFLLFTFYFYLEKKFFCFFVFLFLSLLVREDVAFTSFMLGVVIFIDYIKSKKAISNKQLTINNEQIAISIKWAVTPIIISIIYLVISQLVIGNFSPTSHSPFLYYYGWLKDIDFIGILRHILTYRNFEMIIGFLMPFLFLPLFKPKYLLLALPPFLACIFTASSGGALIFQTHYASLFLPGLFISFIYTLKKLQQVTCGMSFRRSPLKDDRGISYECGKNTPRILKQVQRFLASLGMTLSDQKLILIVLIAVTFYSTLTLGVLSEVVQVVTKDDKNLISIKKEFLSEIPQNVSVATTYDFLTPLSSRERIYSLHYIFIGKQQYSDKDYNIKNAQHFLPEYFLIDFDDFLTYEVQFPFLSWTKKYYFQGDERVREILKDYKVVKVVDSIALFKKGYKSEIKLYEVSSQQSTLRLRSGQAVSSKQQINLDDKIKFLGFDNLIISNYPHLPKPKGFSLGGQELVVGLYWQALKPLKENYQLLLEITNENRKIVYQKIYPLAYGLYPTSKWQVNEIIKINYWLKIPEEYLNYNYNLNINLVRIKGGLEINNLRAVIRVIDKMQKLGKSIKLGAIQFKIPNYND